MFPILFTMASIETFIVSNSIINLVSAANLFFIKDSVMAKPEGVYCVNWLKTEKGDWKITSAVIHSFKK